MMTQRTKKIVSALVKLLLAVALLIYIFHKMDVNIGGIMSSVVLPVYLLGALFCSSVVNTLVANNRWRTFLTMIGVEESFWRLVRVNWVSSFLGLVIPSSQGYDVLRIYKIEQLHPEARGKVGSTVFVERILGLICLAFIAAAAWLFVNMNISFWPILILVAAVAMVVVIIRNDWCYCLIQRVLGAIPFAPKTFGYLGKLYEGLHAFPFSKGLIGSILLILLLQFSNILVVYFLFEACGCHVDLIYHLCYQPLISVITMVPVTFGGIGLREGGFAYFYTQVGVPGETIIAVSLMYYVVVTLIPAMLGGLMYLGENVKKINCE